MFEWLTFWRRRDRDIRDELEYHLEMLAQDRMDRGVASDEAQFAARRKLGNVTRAQENTRAVWIMPAIEAIAQDLAYTLRSFRKAPVFSSLVVGILALGIGASVSIFSLVDGILIRPLPYVDPQLLFALTTYAPRPPFASNGSMSLNDFVQFKAKSHVFSDMAVTFRNGWSRATLTGGYEPVDVQGAFVSPNLFALAGRAPILGRTFTREEDQRSEHVLIISQSLWAERFGSSPDVLGRTLELNHTAWRIIGVAPSDFQLPFLDTQFWAPIHTRTQAATTDDPNPLDHARWDVIARLKPGISLSAAQTEVDAIWSALRAGLSESHTNDVRLVPLREHFSGNIRKPLWLLFGAVVFLLLIACANVANLLLARSAQRARELAVRAAIGAGPGRLFRQLLTEAVSVAFISGACGAVFAIQLIRLLRTLAPANTPFITTITLNGRQLVFALIVSIATGVLLGLTPALHLSRGGVNHLLSTAGTRSTESRRDRQLKSFLVAGEFALAMVLLTGAGLLLRSFLAVVSVNVGFRPQNILTVHLSVPERLNSGQLTRRYEELMQRITALPHVVAVGGASSLFYLDETRTHALRLVEGRAPEPQAKWKPLVWTEVGGKYFEAMGIPLLKGRYFGRGDRADSPLVVIVNQTLARRYWPDTDPIGKRLKGFDARGRHDDWLTVVGVVGDVRAGGLERTPFSQIYELQSQMPAWGDALKDVVVRTTGDPASLTAALRSTIHNVDPNIVVSSITSMEALLSQQETQRRFQTWLISVFSGLALCLAALGIFAVMHYSVAARTSEIGIRMATGASPAHIVSLVLGNGIRLALCGIGIGAVTAMWLTKTIAALLYGITPSDPISFAGAALVLVAVAVFACTFPAIRASHTDPLNTLRQQ